MKPSRKHTPDPAKDYEVGYGRPPKHSRFKPGKSPYPQGRPRGRKNLTTLIRDYAQGRMRVTEGGRDKTLPRFDALLRTMWAQAFKGNLKALTFILQSLRESGLLKEEPLGPEPEMTPEDQAVLDDYLRQHGVVIPDAASTAPAGKIKLRSRRKTSRRRP